MARIERATSPLPRECSTTEPHGRRHSFGRDADKAVTTYTTNCTPLQKPQTLERETGIEPVSLAWKAKVLPLNYSRKVPNAHAARLSAMSQLTQAMWWRRLDSNQRRRKPTDLQSAPFSHSGTPPASRRL